MKIYEECVELNEMSTGMLMVYDQLVCLSSTEYLKCLTTRKIPNSQKFELHNI